MKNFALMGAAGYIAPRHMKAIKENNCNLVVVTDSHDSVGILDSYFPDASFFSEVERFDRHIYKLIKTKEKIDYFSICTPNYLHDAHIRLALRNGADAICEKPLVLKSKNLKYLKELEEETNRKVHVIFQLRYHPTIIALREKYKNSKEKVHISLKYITSRGQWYQHSWKGDVEKSGGLACNIGIHFFDMLIWIFGNPVESYVLESTKTRASGFLTLENATVDWFLSINNDDLSDEQKENKIRAYRSLSIAGEEVDFSGGFEDLHTVTYRNILNGNSFGIDDVYGSLIIAEDVSNGVGLYKY